MNVYHRGKGYGETPDVARDAAAVDGSVVHNTQAHIAPEAPGVVVPMFRAERVDAGNPSLAYAAVKRALDIVLSLVGLLVAALPMLLIALLIKLDDPKGEVVYHQVRLGKGGRPFTIYKFRSMRMDAEADGAIWARKNDSRVTRVGRFLRIMRLDELPQLFNILSGQMSLVGPRPERAFFYRTFEQYIDGFSQRLLVRPGLTGLAQVSGGYDLRPEEKLRLDLKYIRHQTLLLDLRILLKTVQVVIGREGAR